MSEFVTFRQQHQRRCQWRGPKGCRMGLRDGPKCLIPQVTRDFCAKKSPPTQEQSRCHEERAVATINRSFHEGRTICCKRDDE